MHLLTQESPFHFLSFVWQCKDAPQRHRKLLSKSRQKDEQSAEEIIRHAVAVLTLEPGDSITLNFLHFLGYSKKNPQWPHLTYA